MTLQELGFDPEIEKMANPEDLAGFEIGRITKEHKERYIIKTTNHEYDAEITGNLRFSAKSREDYPAVGDFVAFKEFDENSAIIYHILPRKTLLERQAIGKPGEKQLIAANIDVAFIVQAIERDFNINRLERYMAICHSTQIEPVLVLSKIDLLASEEQQEILGKLKNRGKNLKTIMLSNKTKEGYGDLLALLHKGMTYCLIGSSGVGKSTLINNLVGKEYLKTNTLSQSTGKGKHTTSHRELIVLEQGGILIDTPGMRELGITDSSQGVETVFDELDNLVTECKFKDCNHVNTKGCALIKAVDQGNIERETYKNYLKLLREQKWFQSTVAEKRKKDKDFGKMVKTVMKSKKKLKG